MPQELPIYVDVCFTPVGLPAIQIGIFWRPSRIV
jgi:hypothetical protein